MARSTLITIEDVKKAQQVIKDFEYQEANKLPYIKGTVTLGGNRWCHAQKDRVTGVIHKKYYDLTTGRTHFAEVFEKDVIKSFKEYE